MTAPASPEAFGPSGSVTITQIEYDDTAGRNRGARLGLYRLVTTC